MCGISCLCNQSSPVKVKSFPLWILFLQSSTYPCLNKCTVTLQFILIAISLIHYYVIGFMVCPHVAPVRDDVYVSVNNTWGLSLLLRHLYSCLKGLSCSVKIVQNRNTLLNESSCCGSEFSLFIDGSSSASRLNSGKRWRVEVFPFETFYSCWDHFNMSVLQFMWPSGSDGGQKHKSFNQTECILEQTNW